MTPLLAAGLWALVGFALAPLIHAAIVILPAQAEGQATVRIYGRAQRAALRTLAIGAATACVFAWLAWRHGFSWPTLVLSVYAVIFVIIIAIDLEHRLILNRVLVPAAVFALLVAPTLANMSLTRVAMGAAAGFLLFLLPALVMPGGLGGGDVKLAGFLGMVTGFPGILLALMAGVIFGGATTLLLLVTRRIGRRDYIPYGPFLVAGAMLILAQW